MTQETPPPNSNGTGALAKLLNQLNLPTLAMIMLMGGGNWFATQNQGHENRHELDRLRQEVRDEVREIHRNQNVYLDNARRVQENQQLLKDIVQKLDKAGH